MSKRRSTSTSSDVLSSVVDVIDAKIESNTAAATGIVKYNRARYEWSDKIAQEQMSVPIETLLTDDYYWGKDNIWPSVAKELIDIWHIRCDFDVKFYHGKELLKQDTIYAVSYYQAEKIAKMKWSRIASQATSMRVSRDRDLHTVIIETPKGTGKDYEASLIVALLVREYLIQPREDLRAEYNIDPTTTISINLMNRSEDQAKKVTFTEVLKRVNNAFFLDYFPPQVSLDDISSSGKMPQDLKFPKNVVVFPGSGSASTGLGYSLGGEVVDECNFMQLSDSSKKSIFSGQNYDAAEEAWRDGVVRHRSRFSTFRNGVSVCAGLIVGISSTRLVTDFTQRMAQRAHEDKGIYYSTSAFWHRKPVPLSGETFMFDIANMSVVDEGDALARYEVIKGDDDRSDIVAE